MVIAESFTGTATVGSTEWSLPSNVQRRASIANVITANGTATDASTFNTASGTPTNGRKQIFGVYNANAAGGVPATPTMTNQNGVTWTQVNTQIINAGTDRITLFRGEAAASSAGAAQVTHGGVTQTVCAWVWAEAAGLAAGAARQNNVGTNSGTSLSVALASAVRKRNSCVALFGNFDGSAGATQRANWAETADFFSGTIGGLQLQFNDGGVVAEETASYSPPVSTSNAGIVAEFDISLAARTDFGAYFCVLDLNALVAGDVYEWVLYEKALSSSDEDRAAHRVTFAGAQPCPVWQSLVFILKNGWDMGLRKVSGADHSIDWSIRKVT